MMDTADKTIAAYNTSAANYAEKFDNYEVYQRLILDFQTKYITPGSHILDLGCGPGNNIKTLFEKNSTCCFTGIDLSEEFINIASNRFPQFEFHRQDLRKLDLQEKFQVILASFCIVHLNDTETEDFLKQIAQLLPAGGMLYLSYMNGETSGFETTSFSKKKIFFNYYQDDFIIDLLQQNSMEMVEIQKEEYTESDGSITMDTFLYAKKTDEK